MPVHESRYLTWEGKRRGRAWAILNIVIESFKASVFRPAALVIGILGLMVSLVFINIIVLLSGGPLTRDMLFLVYASGYLGVVLQSAILGAGQISNDLQSKSIALYFSHPLTRLDYLLSKFIATFMVVGILSICQSVVLLVLGGLTYSGKWHVDTDLLKLVGGTLAASLLMTVLFTSVTLALSSLTGDRKWPTIGVFAIFLVSFIIGGLAAGISQVQEFFPISVINDFIHVSGYLLGLGSNMSYQVRWSFLVLVGIILVSWAVLYVKIVREEYSE